MNKNEHFLIKVVGFLPIINASEWFENISGGRLPIEQKCFLKVVI